MPLVGRCNSPSASVLGFVTAARLKTSGAPVTSDTPSTYEEMYMKISKLLGFTMAAALCIGGLTTFTCKAAEDSPSGRPARGRIFERLKEKLGLTEDQVAQIKAELAPEKETIKNLILRLHDARVGVREAIHAPSANETSVRAAAAKVGVAEADLAVERLKLYGRLNPILTDEQRQTVKQFEARIDEWMENAVNRIGEHPL